MAKNWYNSAAQKILNGSIDLLNDTIKVMLLGSGYTFDETDDFVSEIASYELTGTGYSRKTLANKSVVLDDTNHRAYLDADDVVWANIDAGQIVGVAIFKQGNDDTDSPLIGYLDEGDDFPKWTNGGDMTLQFPDGVLELKQPA